jgi:DeoR family ulaG and ulaABCDEF operon transcriptional repressor
MLSDPRRQRQIVELLRDRPFASVRALQEQLGSSAATVRRDIEEIDEAGDIGTLAADDGLSDANARMLEEAGVMVRAASAAGAVQ